MNARRFIRKQLSRGRRGVVLVVVVMAVSVASTLGMTVLTAGSTNALIAANVQRGAQAEYLADSALNIAIHQLKTTGTLGELTGVSIAGIDGTADLVLVDLGNNQFEIQANARIGDAGAVMSYKTSARVEVDTSFVPEVNGVPYAMGFSNTGISLNNIRLNINGNIIAKNLLTIPSANELNISVLLGKIFGVGAGITVQIENAEFPKIADISTKYHTQYTYEGMTYNAQPLPVTGNVLSVSLPRPQDLATNPAGIYYINSDVTIAANVTVNGTIRVRNGRVLFNGANITLNPKDDFPALLVDGNLLTSNAARVTINGLAMIGGNLAPSGASNLNSEVTVNGAFLMDGGQVNNLYRGTFSVNYDRDLATVDDFTINAQPRVTLLDWTP